MNRVKVVDAVETFPTVSDSKYAFGNGLECRLTQDPLHAWMIDVTFPRESIPFLQRVRIVNCLGVRFITVEDDTDGILPRVNSLTRVSLGRNTLCGCPFVDTHANLWSIALHKTTLMRLDVADANVKSLQGLTELMSLLWLDISNNFLLSMEDPMGWDRVCEELLRHANARVKTGANIQFVCYHVGMQLEDSDTYTDLLALPIDQYSYHESYESVVGPIPSPRWYPLDTLDEHTYQYSSVPGLGRPLERVEDSNGADTLSCGAILIGSWFAELLGWGPHFVRHEWELLLVSSQDDRHLAQQIANVDYCVQNPGLVWAVPLAERVRTARDRAVDLACDSQYATFSMLPPRSRLHMCAKYAELVPLSPTLFTQLVHTTLSVSHMYAWLQVCHGGIILAGYVGDLGGTVIPGMHAATLVHGHWQQAQLLPGYHNQPGEMPDCHGVWGAHIAGCGVSTRPTTGAWQPVPVVC